MMTNNRRTNSRKARKGFTLLEIMIVFLLFSALLSVSSHIFTISMRAWGTGRLRTEIREDISYTLEKTVRGLKETTNLSQYNSIDHTIQYDDLSGNTYVLYLYNDDDGTLDSNYNESLYDLRKADIGAGDNPYSGEGVLLLQDLVSPDAPAPRTALEININQVTLDFVVQRSDETVRLRTKIKPRNL
jgi:prepilin-type N-terminal cleavage/methylation domain-containing protein